MRKLLLLVLILLPNLIFAQYTVSSGTATPPYVYNEDLVGTGIENVYLLNKLSGATITYTSEAVSVKFYRYQTSLADKVQIPSSDISLSTSGGVTTYTISNLVDSRGYLAEVNGMTRNGIWIIDYSLHQPVLTSISTIESEDKCETLKLGITKSDELPFYSTNGNKKDVRRRYTISYENKVWNGDKKDFETKTVTLPEREIGTEVNVSAPLMDTYFTIKGDQFANYFGIPKQLSTTTKYAAIAVEAHMLTEQEKRNAANEKVTEGEELGGSAPVIINFYGYGNEPVVEYYTWFIFHERDKENPIARYTDRDIKYTFEDAGNYTVKLEVADRSSVCVDTASVTFNVSISELLIPNYFSPGDSPGSNDEFKVAYKSLIKFKCTIFNRWGTKLYEWADPAKGWDGRYKGKYVNTGVYFYVIEAEGSDGKKYKKGGDINVFNTR